MVSPKTARYFKFSFFIFLLSIPLGGLVGYLYSGTLNGALTAAFLTFILTVLEVSLSFENAVINAAVLKEMSPVWRNRFIVWGIPIAVFGMRIIFPLILVSVIAQINPWQALVMAATKPDEYAQAMFAGHMALAGFGGAFLMMVALTYFFDHEKDTHWINWIERYLAALGKIEAISMGVCLLLFFILSRFVEGEAQKLTIIISGIFGMLTFVAVDGVSALLKGPGNSSAAASSGFGLFMYLEILDASFSFDGVIGAFALTNNLFVIAIGLGVGALFVRSLTIYLVDNNTLSNFIYLEHGAFYAIGSLALLMLVDIFIHIPEAVTGLVGALLIALSIWSSILHQRRLLRKEP